MQWDLKGTDSEFTVNWAGRVHQTLMRLLGRRLLQGLPGLESKAKVLPELLLFYTICAKEKVDMRTGYVILPKYGILFPS